MARADPSFVSKQSGMFTDYPSKNFHALDYVHTMPVHFENGGKCYGSKI